MNEETIIIGAGPAGASASIYLAQFLHHVTLIDKKGGYKRTMLAMGMENYLSQEKPITGPRFFSNIEKQLKKYQVKKTIGQVASVSQKKNGEFKIKTKDNKNFSAKYLIIAVGLKDGTLNLKNVDKFYNSSIFHCMTCNWFKNKKKQIANIGNNDGAILNALEMKALYNPSKIIVAPTEKKPKFSRNLVHKAEKEGIKVYFSLLERLLGKNNSLEEIELEDGQKLKIDALFTALGMERVDQFLDKGKIAPKRDKKGFINVNFRTFESSIKNLFAIGPCNSGPDQAIIAAGQGAMAALEIHKRIMREKMAQLGNK